MEDSRSNARLEALTQFTQTFTWAESRIVIDEYPILLTAAMDPFLTELESMNDGNESSLRLIRQHRDMLVACRRDGVDAAFSVALTDSSQLRTLAGQLDQLRKEGDHSRLARVARAAILVCLQTGATRRILDWHIELANSLLEQGFDDPRRVEEMIPVLEGIARVYASQPASRDWAWAQHNLGAAFAAKESGGKEENLRRSIEHHLQSLKGYTRTEAPLDWAEAHYNLGHRYNDLSSGDSVQNCESTITHFESCLEELERDSNREWWAIAHMEAGVALLDRVRGKRSDNIERAIDHLAKAQEVYTRTAFSSMWAMLQYHLGYAFSDRIRGDRSDNLEKSIGFFHNALEEPTIEYHYATLHQQLPPSAESESELP